MASPRSREEAARHRYGGTSARPMGAPYDPLRCAAEVPNGVYGSRQCTRPVRDGALYCAQHARQLEGAA